MPRTRKVNTLDSYATIRAVARAKPVPASPAAARAPKNVAPPDAPPVDLQKPGARVARTAVPVKHPIECFECGYKFQMHGRASNTHCPKCRALLDLTDHEIDAEWIDTIKTAGVIRLTPSGILKNGDLTGTDVVIEGIIESGRVRAMRTLELGAGAIFAEKAISALDLRIGPGAEFKFKQPAKFRNVEVCGTLHAKFEISGVIIVKAGGLLEGEVRAEHLIVEDGGGLKAKVRIAPRGAHESDL